MKAHADDLAQVWKALADPSRRAVLDMLRERPRTTGELSRAFATTRFAVMKHLTVLERAGLVTVRRRGRERWNHLNAVPLQQIHERWITPYAAHWAEGMLRLKRHAERVGKEVIVPATDVAVPLRTMHIVQEVTITAPRATAWKALTQDITAWWGPPYAVEADRMKDIQLEVKPGGRFFEDHGDGGGHIWAFMTGVEPEGYIQFTGPMGMATCALARFSDTLEDTAGGATRVRLTHDAMGDIPDAAIEGYTGGWKDLHERLQAYVERGERRGLKR